jgi:hypothetical protein
MLRAQAEQDNPSGLVSIVTTAARPAIRLFAFSQPDATTPVFG